RAPVQACWPVMKRKLGAARWHARKKSQGNASRAPQGLRCRAPESRAPSQPAARDDAPKTHAGRAADGEPAPQASKANQAVAERNNPSSSIIRSRITNFCAFPVTVIGNSSTKRTYRGTL